MTWDVEEYVTNRLSTSEKFHFRTKKGIVSYKELSITYYPDAIIRQLFFTKSVKNQAPIDIGLPLNWILA